MQKYFSKGRSKREGGLVFMNFLLICNEDRENIIPNVKYQMKRCNIKLGVQYIQYYKVVKIECILFLFPIADLKE